MKTEASRLFDELNRRYWRGQLPRYMVIRRAKLAGGYLGLCCDRTRTILLKAALTGVELRHVLLHEMCHIGMAPNYRHGPRFLRKLRRLGRLGEAGLMEDIEQYDGTAAERYFATKRAAGEVVPEESFRSVVYSDLEGWSFSSSYKSRWSTVARVIARRYDITVAQLRRGVPSAEREWKRLSAERREEERNRARFKEALRLATATAPAQP